jgi:N-acetyl-alpha-D-glucosaminyl L-malate synthase BshA
MKSLRIAIVSHAYPTFSGGNAGEFVHGLASAISYLGHGVHAVIPWEESMKDHKQMDEVQLHPYQAYDRVSYGKASNAYVRSPRLAVALSLARAGKKLYQVVREYDIDIIHAHWAIPMGFVAGLVKSITGNPLVISMHGRDVYVNPEAGFIVPTLWYVKPFLHFAFKYADQLIAVSNNCLNHALSVGAPIEKMQVIYNGANVSRFFPSNEGIDEIRAKYNIPLDAKLLLTVRSLTFRKGLDVFIRCIPKILEDEPKTVALIVGDGPERENLKTLAKELGVWDKIIFSGHVPNAQLPSYENSCDLFVIPSREEGFGVAAAEAMACGKPIVGTTAGGLNETIDHNRTGLLVEPDNPKQLAEAIKRILNNDELATQLGDNAREKVLTDFNWDHIAQRTIEVYKQVLDR